jgi:hypothetical protein
MIESSYFLTPTLHKSFAETLSEIFSEGVLFRTHPFNNFTLLTLCLVLSVDSYCTFWVKITEIH